jgi:hypothetical protein
MYMKKSKVNMTYIIYYFFHSYLIKNKESFIYCGAQASVVMRPIINSTTEQF